jgi:hypothetical protein
MLVVVLRRQSVVLTVTGDADDAVTVVADGSDVKKTLSA